MPSRIVAGGSFLASTVYMYVFKIPAPTPNYLAEVFGGLVAVPWLVALIVSTLWIVYRVFLVFQKPTEELEEILGIDIPPVPDVALARINSDSVLLYWKPPDNYPSQLKHFIQVNGIDVGEVEKTDATIQVTGLQPGNCYGIRAVATNQTGNSSYSGLIQVQTIPNDDGVRASKILNEAAQAQANQSLLTRRTSQSIGGNEHMSVSVKEDGEPPNDSCDPLSALDPLTRSMNSLKQHLAEVQRQIAEEKKESDTSKAELNKKKEELKALAEEGEKSSQEFRKQVNELEKQCKAAQRKKSAKERTLQQKKAERQKMWDEIARWEGEIQETYQNARQSREQKASLEEEHKKQMDNVTAKIEEAQIESTRMEEHLREVGIKVKELDEQRARADQEKYAAEVEAEKRKEEEEQAAENRIQEFQITYSTYWRMVTQLEAQRDMEAEKVAELLRFKDQNPDQFKPIPGLDYYMPPMFVTNRRPRHLPRVHPPSQPNFPANYNHQSTLDSTSSASPSFSPAFPLYSMPNQPSPGSIERSNFTQQQIERLTGGGPMSPSVDTLLPSDLLGDDDDPRTRFGRNASPPREPSNSRPQSFQPSSTDPKAQDPQSPLSSNSKSPSLLSSPHESLSNIPNLYSRDQQRETDERSLPLNSSPFSNMPPMPTSGAGSSRKISSLFNWSGRREKAGVSEPPLLGTLKQGQSQSFPANRDEIELGAPGRRPGWANQVSNLWGKTEDAHPIDVGISQQLSRKTRRGVFGPGLETGESMGESSRPSSTYSFGENLMPQSQQDFQSHGWGPSDNARSRGGAITYDWPSATSGPWSHTQSRRASLQHGSTSNLSIGSTPLDRNEDLISPYAFKKMKQPAPIGTERFRMSQRSNTPKLNPAAPSFTTRLFNRSESKRIPRSEKSAEHPPDRLQLKENDRSRDFDSYSKSSSPSISRKSHDTYSLVTSDSLGESHDSLEPSTSATPSEPALTPSNGTHKESLMQRLQRKSSSTKFWGKDRSSKASSRGAPSTPGELDFEDGDYLGRSIESTSVTPQDRAARGSLSWSRVMGKTKKKGEAAPSETSERASEADVYDDE